MKNVDEGGGSRESGKSLYFGLDGDIGTLKGGFSEYEAIRLLGEGHGEGQVGVDIDCLLPKDKGMLD